MQPQLTLDILPDHQLQQPAAQGLLQGPGGQCKQLAQACRHEDVHMRAGLLVLQHLRGVSHFVHFHVWHITF